MKAIYGEGCRSRSDGRRFVYPFLLLPLISYESMEKGDRILGRAQPLVMTTYVH